MKFKKHILIVGSARSGSSWFSELIAQQYRYRMLFEPEHEFNTPKGKLIADQFITENNYSREAEKYLLQVFKNRVDNDWIAQISNRKWKRHLWPLIPRKFVIKMVRGNLAANFMYNHFHMSTVYLIRNPYDTIKSQSRVKFPWLYNLSHFENNVELQSILKKHFGFTFDQSQFSNLQKLTIRWSIENNPIFEVSSNNAIPYRKVQYEDLISNIDLFRNICKQFQLKPLENLDYMYSQPSSKTHPKSHIIQRNKNLAKFNSEEYKVINEILDQFKISSYPRLH